MTAGPWVYFFASPDERDLRSRMKDLQGALHYYSVKEVVPVCGDYAPPFHIHWALARLESPRPIPLGPEAGETLRGVVRHLQYTDGAQRTELQERSAKEYPGSASTMAVLIPIRKSAAWWNLAQDERQKHFQKPASRENHSSIGLSFADKIYRRLYHARYFDTLPEYDFLTYFEFLEKDREVFKALLSGLRDPERNPEWSFVEMETEIWMVKK